MGPGAPRRAGDLRHRHCLPGADLGRLLAHPAGDPARLRPPPQDPPHVGVLLRADLHPGRQLGSHGGVSGCGGRVRVLVQPRSGLRRGRHVHDGRHDGAAVRRAARALRLASVDGEVPVRRVRRGRRRLLRRQRVEDPGRWVVPARHRSRRVHDDDHVADRPGPARSPDATGAGLAPGLLRQPRSCARSTAGGGGHGGVPVLHPRRDALGPAVERAPQQRRAPSDRHPLPPKTPKPQHKNCIERIE